MESTLLKQNQDDESHGNKDESHDMVLESLGYKDVPTFSFDGLHAPCKVIKCYDGDTVTLIFKYKGEYIKSSCRLLGIDTPEMKGNQKDKAIIARDYIKSRVLNKVIPVDFGKNDKYGRPIVTLYCSDYEKQHASRSFHNSINQEMIDKGYAVSYDGGKKTLL